MSLKQKINHCKRHRRNKRISNIADNLYNYAISFEKLTLFKFVVNPLTYEVIRIRHGNCYNRIIPSFLVPVDKIVTTTINPSEKKYREEVIIPRGVDIPSVYGSETLYMRTNVYPPKPTVSLDI